MATFRLSGEKKKVSVVRRTRPVHVRNTLSVFLTEKQRSSVTAYG